MSHISLLVHAWNRTLPKHYYCNLFFFRWSFGVFLYELITLGKATSSTDDITGLFLAWISHTLFSFRLCSISWSGASVCAAKVAGVISDEEAGELWRTIVSKLVQTGQHITRWCPVKDAPTIVGWFPWHHVSAAEIKGRLETKKKKCNSICTQIRIIIIRENFIDSTLCKFTQRERLKKLYSAGRSGIILESATKR